MQTQDVKVLGVVVVALVALAGGWNLVRSRHHKAVQIEEVADNDVSTPTQVRRTRKIQQVQQTRTAAGISSNLRIDLALLLKTHPELQRLNPGLDLASLKENDPRFAQVKIPRGLSLYAMKDPDCASASMQVLGRMSEDKLTSETDRTRAPSFMTFATDKNQTLGQFSEALSNERCVLGVYASSSIDSVRLPPGTRDLASLLPPGTQAVPQLFDFNGMLKDGQTRVMESIKNGDPREVQVFTVGANWEAKGLLPPGMDPTKAIPVKGLPLPSQGVKVYALPMPSGDPSLQIAAVNNGIVYAVNNGATYVMVPLIDPNTIQAATEFAVAHGAQVVMVPRDATLPTANRGHQPASTHNK